MHLLVTFINLGFEQSSTEKVFFVDYSNYVRPPTGTSSEDLTLVQVSNKSFAPHYSIQQGGVQHSIYSGNDNVFAAIMVFFYFIKEKFEGKFGANYKDNLVSMIF